MVKVGVIIINSFSHVQTHLCLALELQDRGHDVIIFAFPDAAVLLTGAGVPTRVITGDSIRAGTVADDARKLAGLSALEGLRHTIDVFLREHEGILVDAPPLVRAENLDLLIGDQAASAHAVLAAHLDLPYVAVCNAGLVAPDPVAPLILSPRACSASWLGRAATAIENAVFMFLIRHITADIQRRCAQLGLPIPTPLEQCWSPALFNAILAPGTPSLTFPRARPIPNLHFIGRWATRGGDDPLARDTPFPFDRLDRNKRLVYISMGTAQTGQLALQRTLLEACARVTDVQPVLTLGRPENFPGAPTKVSDLADAAEASKAIVVDFAPQTELVKRASAVITHGGMNSAMMAAAFAVPQIIVPVTNDQPGVAARVVHAGVGVCIPLARVTVDSMSDALHHVLNGVAMRERTEQVAQEFVDAGGVVQAADIVEEVISSCGNAAS